MATSLSAPTLRQYQTDSLDALWREYAAGKNRLLLKKPTGTGKTVTFAALLTWAPFAKWLAKFPATSRRMLVIAHREELLEQAAEKIQTRNPGLMVQIEQADRYAANAADVVVASIQTLSARKFSRLKRLLQTGPFRIVVVDEAHHAAADTYRSALVHLGFLPAGELSEETNVEAARYEDVEAMQAALAGWDDDAPMDRILVGVTATPNRTDAIGLGCVFQSIAYSYDLRKAIEDKWLVPIVPWVVETETSLDAVKMTHGDFNQKQLADTVNTPERNEKAIAGWREHAEHRPTLAFTVDVAHAHDLAAAFRAKGYEAAAVSGETPREERRSMLQAFRDGRLDVLANCMVLSEGTDLPMASCILHAKPTKSATLYEQMTGRGLRIHPGKTDCIVLDVVDVARRHSLQTAPVLYGLPPGLNAEGKTLEELNKLLEELLAKTPGMAGAITDNTRRTLKDLNALASTFDIWSIRPMDHFATGLSMTWLRVDDEAFRIEYPWGEPGTTEIVDVRKNLLGQFEVVLHERHYDAAVRRGWSTAEQTIGTGIPEAVAALKIAESFVRQSRPSVVRLKDNDAPWKRGPATPKQLGLLKKWGVPVPANCTAGQASQLIDHAKTKKGWV